VANKIIVDKSLPCGQHQYRPNTAKFDGTTTYRSEFKGKRGDLEQNNKHFSYQQNDLPFYGHTTYGDSYTKYKIEAEQTTHCCKEQYVGSQAKFEGKTSYKDVNMSIYRTTTRIRLNEGTDV
jgi:hypothetical protein